MLVEKLNLLLEKLTHYLLVVFYIHHKELMFCIWYTLAFDGSQGMFNDISFHNGCHMIRNRVRQKNSYSEEGIFFAKSLTYEFDPCVLPTSLIYKDDPRVWPTRMIHEFYPREWPTSLTYENGPRECLHEFHSRESPTRPMWTTRFSTLLFLFFTEKFVRSFILFSVLYFLYLW